MKVRNRVYITADPSESTDIATLAFKNGKKAVILINERKKLIGLVTRRDVRGLSFENFNKIKLLDIATKENLITAPVGMAKTKLIIILLKYKLNGIMIVSKNGTFKSYITYDELIEENFNCFILMPFHQPFFHIYEDYIKPTILSNFRVNVKKADEIFRPTPIIETIQIQIDNSDFIIADVSEKNPNVYYEIGYAHATEKPIIFITNNIKELPFDISHQTCIQYDYAPEAMKIFEKKLILAIKEILGFNKG